MDDVAERDPLQSLFADSIDLFDAEEILEKLDYAATKARAKTAQRKLDLVKAAVADLLPGTSPEHIDILGPRLPGDAASGGIRVLTPSGSVPLTELSLGYQSVFALTVDLACPMRPAPFTRPTLIAAVELLEQHSQARFNQVVLRLGLEDEISSTTTLSVAKKCDLLGRIVVQRGDTVVDTLDGHMTLGESVIRQAAQLAQQGSDRPLQTAFARGVARDGYVLVWDAHGRNASIRAALPDEVQLPEADDEVHQLLKRFGFETPRGHLDQAIEAHTRGDWAACNGQIRTFLESLFDDIARNVRPQEAAQRPTSENRRALLAEIGFLAVNRNEWTQDGKNYVNGLFKMLHTEGSHPGLSDEDHSTFRLHVVLVTARTFLRRLANGQ